VIEGTMNPSSFRFQRSIMRLLVKVALLLSLALVPVAALANPSATTSISIIIPEQPADGGVISSCDGFQVTTSANKAYCTITVAVGDATLQNKGWKLSLNATNFTCACGGTLPPNALTIESSSGPVLINGQPIDLKGGPSLQANAVGRSPDGSRPLLVAKPGYGNGAYAVTLTLRLSYPAKMTPGLYVPTWVVNVDTK
jgi:hypothetical protein